MQVMKRIICTCYNIEKTNVKKEHRLYNTMCNAENNAVRTIYVKYGLKNLQKGLQI